MPLSRFSALGLVLLLTTAPVWAQDDAPTYIPQQPPAASSSTRTETRITTLEDQLRTLSGRIEQVEFAVRRVDAAMQRLQADDDARLTKLESTVVSLQQQAAAPPPPPPVVVQPPAPVIEQNGTLGAIKMQNGKVTGGVNNPQSPPLPNAPADYGLTTEEQYERAFGLLRAANYPDAETAFKTFIEKNPKDKLIDNAKYWYGETLYVRAKFDQSAVAFADAFQTNPRGTKAPDSLLKLGMSLGQINKIPDACVTLGELKSKYPNASASIKARADDERTRLKCPAR